MLPNFAHLWAKTCDPKTVHEEQKKNIWWNYFPLIAIAHCVCDVLVLDFKMMLQKKKKCSFTHIYAKCAIFHPYSKCCKRTHMWFYKCMCKIINLDEKVKIMEDDEEDVLMTLRAFLVCLVNVSVLLLLFFIIFWMFFKDQLFLFSKTLHDSFICIWYIRQCYCVSFWINRQKIYVYVFRSMWPSASRIINKKGDTK